MSCILAKWFWPTEMSLSLTHRSLEASCIKWAETYFGRRSASLIKEFWTLGILSLTVSEPVMVETIPHSNIGLSHCLWICKMVVGLGTLFCWPISLSDEICVCSVLKSPRTVL